MAIIGMDIHRSFAQAAFLQDGRVKREQRVELIRDQLIKFAKSLSNEDEVVFEATGNSAAVERISRPFVKRVVVANPRMVRAVAYARVKTDKIDAVMLARLHAGGFLGCGRLHPTPAAADG
jgi:transposase